jgi:putative membrane protein
MSVPAADLPHRTADRHFYVINAVVSVLALSGIAWLLLGHRGVQGGGLAFMPAVNASLNATAACLLIAGRRAIARGARRAHRGLMISAFVASSLFLVGYLAYHYVHGDTHFVGAPWLKVIYLLILATHVLLSMTVVPLALAAFWFAFRGAFATHKKVTRVLYPAWLYVSVTGVIIFFMLRGSPPAL